MSTVLLVATVSSTMTASAFLVERSTELLSSSCMGSLPKCHLSTRSSVGRDMTSPLRRMASTSSSRTSSPSSSSSSASTHESTQLSYRMGDEEDGQEQREAHREAVEGSASAQGWWLWTGPQVPSEQMLMDKYLESIDRRYHRLHDDDKVGSIGWTWNWLYAQPSQSRAQEEDALCVLGLADLASERLLKQHQRKQMKPTPPSAVLDVVASPEGRLSAWTAFQKRQTLVALAARQRINKMLRRTSKALTKVPSALLSSVLNLSGAKKTALVLLSLLIFLVKPFSQA